VIFVNKITVWFAIVAVLGAVALVLTSTPRTSHTFPVTTFGSALRFGHSGFIAEIPTLEDLQRDKNLGAVFVTATPDCVVLSKLATELQRLAKLWETDSLAIVYCFKKDDRGRSYIEVRIRPGPGGV
jgi:hypothetical protein